jgi:CheY-like chemotaxis protein
LDLAVPVLGGQSVLETLRAEDPDTPVLLITAVQNADDLAKAQSQKIHGYLLKPCAAKDLLVEIARIAGLPPPDEGEAPKKIEDTGPRADQRRRKRALAKQRTTRKRRRLLIGGIAAVSAVATAAVVAPRLLAERESVPPPPRVVVDESGTMPAGQHRSWELAPGRYIIDVNAKGGTGADVEIRGAECTTCELAELCKIDCTTTQRATLIVENDAQMIKGQPMEYRILVTGAE